MGRVVMENIKEWYLKNYPADKCGGEIRENATFSGAFNCLDNYGDIYLYIGVWDSVVRGRIFEELASRAGVSYQYIEEQWHKCHTLNPLYNLSGEFSGVFLESETGRRLPAVEVEQVYSGF